MNTIDIASLSKKDNVFFPFFSTIEGDIVEKYTEDGLEYYPKTQIRLDIGMDTWVHNHVFTGDFEYFGSEDSIESIFVTPKSQAENLIKKMEDRGNVNLDNWTNIKDIPEDETTLEQKWSDEFEIERANGDWS